MNFTVGQEYETNVSVQQVLEQMSETILQIVLFQVEAKENQSELVNLNIKPLLGSMRFLVEQAKKKANNWTGKEEEKNKKNMMKACDTMSNACETIDRSMEILKNDKFNQKAKDEMLW